VEVHPHIILFPVQVVVWRFRVGVESVRGLDLRRSSLDVMREWMPRRMSVVPDSLSGSADAMDRIEQVAAKAAVMGCVRFMVLSYGTKI
jgi:hypothetical protein